MIFSVNFPIKFKERVKKNMHGNVEFNWCVEWNVNIFNFDVNKVKNGHCITLKRMSIQTSHVIKASTLC